MARNKKIEEKLIFNGINDCIAPFNVARKKERFEQENKEKP